MTFVGSRNTPDQGTTQPTGTNGYPNAVKGAWQTLLRTPLVDTVWPPKDIAGRGLTSTLWPPNFGEEEPQLEDKSENNLRTSRARSGNVTGQIGQTACEMESREPGLADGR